MNRTDRNTAGDAFERRLIDGLERLASTTPSHAPGEFDPDRWETPHRAPAPRRPALYVLTAAAVVAVIVAGLVVAAARTDVEPARSDRPVDAPPSETPSETPSVQESPAAPEALPATESTVSTIPDPVRGVPTCGAELPVTIDIPSAERGPIPGPGVAEPTVEGQFAQFWELSSGTIEVRWPVDPRQIYDLERLRGDPTAFDSMSVATPDDGSRVMIHVPSIDPSLSPSVGTLTMIATPAVADVQPPCDLLQVRFVDGDGNQTTRGYDITDFNGRIGDNGEPRGSFGIDLDPLVISTGPAAGAPDAGQVATCGDNDIDSDVAGPTASTPAEALAAYLASDQVPARFGSSGYSEFDIDADEFQYAIITDDGTLITLFTVGLTGDDWAVVHVTSVGC